MKFNKIKKIPLYIKGKILKLLDIIQIKRRQSYIKKQRDRLQNKTLTLLSNNCNGWCIIA